MASRTLTCSKRFALYFSKPKVFSCESFTPLIPAFFSTHIVGDRPVLVRDFIWSALYDPNHGYFSHRSGSVGMLEESIKFNRLQGRKAYMKYLEGIYSQNDIAWFTPVELFKPWYAYGIAEAILRTADLSVPLKIYEIGGGSGTCAKGIMDYLMLNAPARVYNSMSYISVEISSSLAKKQMETVGAVRSHLSKFRVECHDAADKNAWAGSIDQQPCWVIMLEVLDNLPHDLIYSENQASPWMEVWVEKQHNRVALSELYKPLQDPLIKRCVEIIDLEKDHNTQGRAISAARHIWSKVFPKPRRCWLPTGCLKLLEVLHGALPKMSLIASDFSYLPDVRIPGERAPLVSTKKDGSSSDHSSYLDAKGDADIFFPTDFWLLERMDHFCSGWLKACEYKSSKQGRKRRIITLDTSSFMEEFGLPSKTRTKDGYNPLLDDFKNTKFYLSVPTHNIK
ncbi:protein arginine methyltransferase NDUFAF7 homolog, mitochondrial isoform X1 [Vitis vinifera]|uniref:protein arginine methyltransferase NDUFAF7 homolog, mitochondrial isoform X1 n=1 Tax=Vitis vinifera TaxID=29760 RepID=UPI00054032FF|nr:protein arginine methyltransferase NDUFAF7 homolog, mitochondrial isoform X1 [Vitis vinifera]|eukprot:XP_010650269.1 PREDICTED: protein arginine methyltransferase NDUFAF7 homolog, mitochondrial isoform X3 [Vitis vinifera]